MARLHAARGREEGIELQRAVEILLRLGPVAALGRGVRIP
jgi:hypothetical protein